MFFLVMIIINEGIELYICVYKIKKLNDDVFTLENFVFFPLRNM